jgi:hypothetical protein
VRLLEASLFWCGEIELRETGEIPNEAARVVSPNEFAVDLSYSLKLVREKFSMAVGGRFINSNLKVASDANDATAAVLLQ